MPAGEVRLPEAARGVRHGQGRLLPTLHRLQEGQRRGEELYAYVVGFWGRTGIQGLDTRLQLTMKSRDARRHT